MTNEKINNICSPSIEVVEKWSDFPGTPREKECLTYIYTIEDNEAANQQGIGQKGRLDQSDSVVVHLVTDYFPGSYLIARVSVDKFFRSPAFDKLGSPEDRLKFLGGGEIFRKLTGGPKTTWIETRKGCPISTSLELFVNLETAHWKARQAIPGDTSRFTARLREGLLAEKFLSEEIFEEDEILNEPWPWSPRAVQGEINKFILNNPRWSVDDLIEFNIAVGGEISGNEIGCLVYLERSSENSYEAIPGTQLYFPSAKVARFLGKPLGGGPWDRLY